MYKQLCLMVLRVGCCFCFAEYEMFQGFDDYEANIDDMNNTETSATISDPVNQTDTYNATALTVPASTVTAQSTEQTTSTTSNPLSQNISDVLFSCPEEEEPSNIGPYEVPTQRDLALLARKTLKRMFGSYHQKALYFLNDIKKVTGATSEILQKCHGNKDTYKRCVKHVKNQCELITKSLVISLERQRHDVAAFTEGAICSMTAMKADPVKLVKVLAMEDASLDFALPAFLRLLNACSKYCKEDLNYEMKHKPLRHMTDTDLVIKHLLTRKNYRQLIF